MLALGVRSTSDPGLPARSGLLPFDAFPQKLAGSVEHELPALHDGLFPASACFLPWSGEDAAGALSISDFAARRLP